MSRSVHLLALVALTACRSNPSPPRPAPGPPALLGAQVESGAYWGSPLSGPTESPGKPSDPDQAPALDDESRGDIGEPEERIRIELWYLRGPLPGDPSPLAPFTDLAADITAVDPWLPAAGLLSSARWLQGSAARGRGADLATSESAPASRVEIWEGALPPGSTGHISLAVRETVPDPRDWLNEHAPWGPLEKRVEVHVHRGLTSAQGGYAASLVVQDLEPRWLHDASELEALDRAAAVRRASARREHGPLRRELLGVTPTLGDSDGAQLFVWRSPIAQGEGSHFAALVTLLDAEDAPSEDLDSRAVAADLERSSEAFRQRHDSAEHLRPEVLERAQALAALGDPSGLRSSLVYLGETCGAPLTTDLALVAREDDLSDFVERVVPRGNPRAELAKSPTTLGWTLEAGAYLVLADELAAGRLNATLQALLLRHGGETGRFPGLLRECVVQARGVEDLHQRLVLENRIFLRDRHPAARVRSHGWLMEHGIEVPGFDPLGGAEERRSALNADEDRRLAPEQPESSVGTTDESGGQR